MKYHLSFTLNGLPVDALAKATDTLLDCLAKGSTSRVPDRGCDTGIVGPARSC